MVYKKYVYKRGRKHGPYYYHSYREGNRIRKLYIGDKEDFKKWKNSNKKSRTTQHFLVKSLVIAMPLIVILIFAGFFIYQSEITGKISLNLENEVLSIKLKQGGLVPINSRLIIEQNGTTKEILLSELVKANSQGNFYIEGLGIGGDGEGYGVLGEKEIYPMFSLS